MIVWTILGGTTVLTTLSVWWYRLRYRPTHPQISLLVPWRPDPSAPQRETNWRWLEQYWRHELPDAELVIGTDRSPVFSKARAVNHAARKAHGRIFVILDADAYIRGADLQHCANQIDMAIKRGHRRWMVPYRHLYRLTEAATQLVLDSDPRNPARFTEPPAPQYIEGTHGSGHGHAYRFGAMVTVVPRAAFFLVGGMPSAFAGWGGEDVSFVHTLNTLYVPFKTSRNDVLHLWHANIGDTHDTRMWHAQAKPRANSNLASRYSRANGDTQRMRALLDE